MDREQRTTREKARVQRIKAVTKKENRKTTGRLVTVLRQQSRMKGMPVPLPTDKFLSLIVQ